jgi:hypothetical protein
VIVLVAHQICRIFQLETPRQIPPLAHVVHHHKTDVTHNWIFVSPTALSATTIVQNYNAIMHLRDYQIIDEKVEISPPVSPVRVLEPTYSRNLATLSQASMKTHPPTQLKEFGPQTSLFPSFQTTQEELLRVAIEKKRASSRIRQSMALRAAVAEWESPFVVEVPEDDFAAVTEEDGEFVMSCLQ